MAAKTPVQQEPPASPPLTADERALLAALAGEVPQTYKSSFYLLGLILVALAMIALSLIYLTLVGGLGWLLYWHATENFDLLTPPVGSSFLRRRRQLGYVLLYILPLLLGLVLLFFMLKPLLAPRRREFDGLPVRREEQPLLFAYVDKLSDILHTPRPRQIMLDCNVNASASFRRGIFSVLGNDLTLRLGLPLVSGMSLRDFSGVLAHELGHFSQGLGMRIS